MLLNDSLVFITTMMREYTTYHYTFAFENVRSVSNLFLSEPHLKSLVAETLQDGEICLIMEITDNAFSNDLSDALYFK